MSCKDFEHLIALHVGGDVSESERQQVELHLSTCSECWDLAEDLKESQSVFKSIRGDVPNQTMLSAVRARVLNDGAGRESSTWFERFFLASFRQKATLAGIALLMVGGGALWLLRDSAVLPVIPSAPPRPAAISPPVVPEELPQTVSSRPASKPPVRRLRSAPVPIRKETQPQEPQPQESQAQLTIRLVTDDPKVIIYWLGDEKGD